MIVDTLLKVRPPPGTARTPSDICCVVDTSGSMCSAAKASGVEAEGLSLLDIVKHAVSPISHNSIAPQGTIV